jgi:hypothetical protein
VSGVGGMTFTGKAILSSDATSGIGRIADSSSAHCRCYKGRTVS